MERIKNEPEYENDFLTDSGTMHVLGINMSSSGIVYLPPEQLRLYFLGKVGKVGISTRFIDGQYQFLDNHGENLGTPIQEVKDVFDEALPKLELSAEDKKIILGNIPESSKWLPLIERSINPINEEMGFFNSRLIIAANLFSNLKNAEVAQIKIKWMLGATTNDFDFMSSAESELDSLITDFLSENPKYLKFFGISEDYLYNMAHAQLTIPTLVAKRRLDKNSDKITKFVVQDIAKRDINVLTALMMHRAVRYLTGEAKATGPIDADMSQIIASAEIPPDEFLELDNQRRSGFANMLGIFQDITFKNTFPNVYQMGSKELEKIFPQMDYLARTHYLLKVLPHRLEMGALTEYDPEGEWSEVCVKSAVSSTRKSSLPELALIKKLSNFYNFKDRDPNFRLDLFKRLEFLLRDRGQSPKIHQMKERIEQRLNNIELVRFRLYLSDEDFDEFVTRQISFKVPDLIIDVYENDEINKSHSSRSAFETSDQSPLNRLNKAKLETMQKANKLSHIYVALHWKREIFRNGPTTSFQIAPLRFLRGNYQTRGVFLM